MRWKGLSGCEKGAAGIEFAVIGAAFCILVLVTGDLGMGFYSYMQVQNSAQAGAQYAAVHGFNSSSITTAVSSATSTTGISATPAPTQFCGCVVNKQVVSATCGTTCADGMTTGTYVTASAARDFSPIVAWPGFQTTYHQTATSTVRIQ